MTDVDDDIVEGFNEYVYDTKSNEKNSAQKSPHIDDPLDALARQDVFLDGHPSRVYYAPVKYVLSLDTHRWVQMHAKDTLDSLVLSHPQDWHTCPLYGVRHRTYRGRDEQLPQWLDQYRHGLEKLLKRRCARTVVEYYESSSVWKSKDRDIAWDEKASGESDHCVAVMRMGKYTSRNIAMWPPRFPVHVPARKSTNNIHVFPSMETNIAIVRERDRGVCRIGCYNELGGPSGDFRVLYPRTFVVYFFMCTDH